MINGSFQASGVTIMPALCTEMGITAWSVCHNYLPRQWASQNIKSIFSCKTLRDFLIPHSTLPSFLPWNGFSAHTSCLWHAVSLCRRYMRQYFLFETCWHIHMNMLAIFTATFSTESNVRANTAVKIILLLNNNDVCFWIHVPCGQVFIFSLLLTYMRPWF